jgi:tetratricopeptide (TPR) repeat protein
MDRTPSAQAPGYIDALELPILMTQLKPPVGQVLHPVDKNAPVMMARRNADKSATILGTGSHQGFSLTVNGLALPKDAQRSRSHRSYFAEAYRSIKLGDYDAANKTFGEIVGHYDMLSEPTRFMLPYWAIVSVRSKSVDAIEKQLDSVSPTYRRSSYYLARAVLLAAHGDINKSLELLRSARTRCTDEHTDGLPPDYVYAETVEWLYQETKRTEFRNEVLDWSVKNQVIHPWLAWPYAMEAEFQTDTVRRAQAIAMASYLDAGSARIAALPESVRKSAKLSKKGNPFSALNETMQAIAINVPDAT